LGTLADWVKQVNDVLLVSVEIMAFNYASAVFNKLGIDIAATGGIMGAATLGAVALGAAIAATGVASVVMATGFDQAMHKVAGLTPLIQDSGHDMQWWSEQVLALAPQIDVAPKKLADALYFVASAGVPASQVMNVLRYSAMAAAATMGDMKKTADLVTSAMNVYKNQGMDAATATNVIVDAVKNGKVEMQALQTSFAFVAITGLSAKFSLQEVAAAVSALTQVSGSTAARRVQMDLDNLMRSLGDVVGLKKRAQDAGLAFDEMKFASSGLIDRLKMLMNMSGFTSDILDDLRKKAGGNEQVFEQMALTAAENSATFKKLAGGAAAMIPAVILMNDKGATFNKIYTEMMDKTDKVTAAFNIMRESTGQKWNMFVVTLESIFTLIGLQILPAVNALLTSFIGAGRAFISWFEFPGMIDNIKTALMGIGIVIAVILIPALWGMAAAWIAGPGGVITASMLALAAIGTVLGFVIKALIEHFGGWDAIMRQLQPVLKQLQDALKWVGDQLQAAFNNEEMQNALGALRDAFQQLWTQLQPLMPVLKIVAMVIGIVLVGALYLAFRLLLAFISVLPSVIYAFASIIRIVADLARIIIDLFTNWGDLGAAFDALGHDILILLHNILDAALIYVSTLFGDIGKAIAGKIGEWWNDVTGAVGLFFSSLGTAFQVGGSLIAQTVEGWWSAIVGVFTRLVDGLRTIILNVIYFIVGAFILLYEHVPIVRQFVDGVIAIFERLHSGAVIIFTRMAIWLGEQWARISSAAHVAWLLFQQYIVGPVTQVANWLEGRINAVRVFLGALWALIVADVRQAWNAFVQAIQAKVNDVLHATQSVTNPITDTIGNLINLARGWGSNLINNFINGIYDKFNDLRNAFQNVIDIGNNFLHGRSPPPGWPEQGQFGANLVRVFSQGIIDNKGVLSSAMAQLTASAQSQMNATVGSGGGRGFARSGAHIAAVGIGPGTQNITINFPNATNADQIEEALNRVLGERDRDNYAKNRRPGANRIAGGRY
jgi:TP901 family phage tail tape measure protein